MAPASLIIPIETKVRELHSKALLAACAAEAGFQVFLGDQRVIASSLHQLPQSIYVDKSISRTKIPHFERLRRLGFSIVAWCEEGLVYRDKAAYQRERICAESLHHLDAFFAWGEVQRGDILQIVPDARDKVHALGNPRLDVLRPSLRIMFEHEASAIRARYGPFILINTNFSRYNRFRGRENVTEVLRSRRILKTPDEEIFYERFVDHLGLVFQAFVAMIPRLTAAFPDHTIVVRPHPSENHDRWRDLLAPIDNVCVIAEGAAVPWLMAAETVIHNACTTGVEAYLLDRPTIAYVPVVDQVFNRLSHLPNAVSDIALTIDEVIERARALCAGTPLREDISARKKEVLQRHVSGTNETLATHSILRTLIEIEQQSRWDEPKRWQRTGARLLLSARQKAAQIRRTIRKDQALTAYMDQKFPQLSLVELETVLSGIVSALGHSAALHVTKHPRLASCFVVTADRSAKLPRQRTTAADHTSVPQLDSVAAQV